MSKTLQKLAVVVPVVLILAGCSNAPAGTDTGSNGASNTAVPVETRTHSSTDNNTAVPVETATGTGGGDATSDRRAQGVKFADCMRKNGIPEFPDPDASGDLTIENVVNGSGLDTDSAAFKRAIGVCKDLQPPGFTGGNRSPEQQQAALDFAQCIRDNGVQDFPDPANGEPMIDTNRIPSANQPGGMGILRDAMSKCRGLAGDAGVTEGQ